MSKSPTSRATAVTMVTTAETDVLTGIAANDVTPRIEGSIGAQTVSGPNVTVSGVLNITTGAGTTAVTIRCKELSAAGTQIGTSQVHTIGAAVSGNIPFCFQDATGYSSYKITAQATGATGNSTVNEIVAYAETDG